MTAALTGLLVALIVISAWIGAAGFARLRSALDRLHCVTFVYVGCGVPLVALALVVDGPSQRAFKILLLVAVSLVAGASVNQAVARAVVVRGEAGEAE